MPPFHPLGRGSFARQLMSLPRLRPIMADNTRKTDNFKGKDIRWEPGQSGNPAGRPKGARTGLRARLLRELEKQALPDVLAQIKSMGFSIENGTVAEVAAIKLSQELQRNWEKGFGEAWDRVIRETELPLPKALELTGASGGPILSVDLYDDALNDEICKRLVPGWGAEEQAEAEESATPDAE